MTDTLKLPARLDLSAAPQLLADVSAADLSNPFTFDAEDVTHFGAICAQTIIAAARSAKAAGGSITITNLGERAETQLEIMGLSGAALMEGAHES